MFWPDFLRVPVNLVNAGAFFKRRHFDMSKIPVGEEDNEYLKFHAEIHGIDLTDDDFIRFSEYCGKLANDGVMDEADCREEAFKNIYGVGR